MVKLRWCVLQDWALRSGLQLDDTEDSGPLSPRSEYPAALIASHEAAVLNKIGWEVVK